MDDLHAWETHLGRVPGELVDEVLKSAEKAAVNIKKDWRDAWMGYHTPFLPDSVTYDRTYGIGSVEYEIGPDKSKKGKQGGLGNIMEFGTVKNAPIPGGAPALAKEQPRFIAAQEKLLGDVLDG